MMVTFRAQAVSAYAYLKVKLHIFKIHYINMHACMHARMHTRTHTFLLSSELMILL